MGLGGSVGEVLGTGRQCWILSRVRKETEVSVVICSPLPSELLAVAVITFGIHH